MITTVLIDIDDTLIDFNKSADAAIRGMFAENRYPYSDGMMSVYYEVSRPLWDRVEKGEITGDELRAVRWGIILERLGLEGDSKYLEKEYRKHLSKHWPLIEGADVLLKYLSEKYTVCVASNAGKSQQEARLKGSGLIKYIDHIFVSGEIGYEKPLPEFFNACFERLGNPPKEEIIMIGDSPAADIGGGKAAGIKTCWFNPLGKSNREVGADYDVRSLMQIMQIL